MAFEFAHANLNILDREKSIAFYQRALGMRITRESHAPDGSFILTFMQAHGNAFPLELTWLRDRETPYELGDNESHLAYIADDFDAAHTLHEQMQVICFENPGMGIYFIEDPDGNWIELVPET